MKKYCIQTTHGDFRFTGEYMREMEKPNWHYYQTEDHQILHFRKEHMVYVIEKNIPVKE